MGKKNKDKKKHSQDSSSEEYSPAPSKKKKGDVGDQVPMAVDVIPVLVNSIAAAASTTGTAAAAVHSAPATPENVSNGNIFKLVKQLYHRLLPLQIKRHRRHFGRMCYSRSNRNAEYNDPKAHTPWLSNAAGATLLLRRQADAHALQSRGYNKLLCSPTVDLYI